MYFTVPGATAPRLNRNVRHETVNWATAGSAPPGFGEEGLVAIQQLDEQQVRTMSATEKDRWWLENVYKGDMPQLTVRSAITGMTLGSVLSLTNLYIGIQTGWTLGVGITSVILAFAAFKVLSRTGMGREITILENNAMQSIATAAGYMTAPLVTSLSAYMIITESSHSAARHDAVDDRRCPCWGCSSPFRLKRRFINEDQYPFPEGQSLRCGARRAPWRRRPRKGLFKAKILSAAAAALSALDRAAAQ